MQPMSAREKELILAIQNGNDSRSLDELTRKYMPLVKSIAWRFAGRGEPIEDLVQVGTIGLLKTFRRFDIEREVAFSTYAYPTIIGEIKRYFRDTGRAIKVSRGLREMSIKANAAKQLLHSAKGKEPSLQEVAEAIGSSLEETLEALGVRAEVYSLDGGFQADTDGCSLIDTIGFEDPALAITDISMQVELLLEAAKLNAQEKNILYMRFWLDMPQGQIAEVLGVSPVQVSRLIRHILARLENPAIASTYRSDQPISKSKFRQNRPIFLPPKEDLDLGIQELMDEKLGNTDKLLVAIWILIGLEMDGWEYNGAERHAIRNLIISSGESFIYMDKATLSITLAGVPNSKCITKLKGTSLDSDLYIANVSLDWLLRKYERQKPLVFSAAGNRLLKYHKPQLKRKETNRPLKILIALWDSKERRCTRNKLRFLVTIGKRRMAGRQFAFSLEYSIKRGYVLFESSPDGNRELDLFWAGITPREYLDRVASGKYK